MGILQLAINSKTGWLSTPVGGYITPAVPPPTDDPSFRYVLCTAGESGSGGYNEGVLTDEEVTGVDPTIIATAVVALIGSPMYGGIVDLINTSRVFLRPGTVAGPIVDSQNKAHTHSMGMQAFDNTGGLGGSGLRVVGSGTTGSSGGTEGHPRYMPIVYYRRIL